MSNLEGDLTPAAIGEVLEILATRNPAATWVISDGQDEKVIYFSTGGIRLYSSGERRVASLEGYLVDRGLVRQEDLDLALASASSQKGEDIDEILEVKGLLPRPKYLEAVSEIIFLELCDVTVWENAIHEFYEGNPPPEIFDENHPAVHASVKIKALAGRVKEWCQEWSGLRSKLYSERLHPRLEVAPDTLEARAKGSAPLRKLLPLVASGDRSLRDLARRSGLGFPQVAKTVFEGLREGFLRGTLIPHKEPTTHSDIVEDIERLESALDQAINSILIHKRIAEGFEKIDEAERASEHYHTIGDLHTQAGRVPKALESYRRAIGIAPQNIDAHECLIRRLQDHNLDDQAHSEILGLSRKLISFGLFERALDCLRGVKGKPGQFDARVLFGDVLSKLGRVGEAVVEYLGIAREKKKVGQNDGLDELYRKVLALDPQNREARGELYREEKRLAGKVIPRLNIACGIAAAVLVCGWIWAEVSVRSTTAHAASVASESLRQGKSNGLEVVRSIARRFPVSLGTLSLPAVERSTFEEGFWAIEEALVQASDHRKEGRLEEARAAYTIAASSELAAHHRARAKKGLEDVEIAVNEGKDLRRNAKLYLDSRFFEDAFVACRKLLDKYPDLTLGVEIPFYVKTDPPEAQVKINGLAWGITPAWVSVPLHNLPDLVIEKKGYATVKVSDLAARRAPLVHVTMQKSTKR